MIVFETNKMLYWIFIFSCGNTFPSLTVEKVKSARKPLFKV